MGHATNLVGLQAAPVAFRFHTLPIFAGVASVAAKTNFRLLEGYSAETSGTSGAGRPPAAVRRKGLTMV